MSMALVRHLTKILGQEHNHVSRQVLYETDVSTVRMCLTTVGRCQPYLKWFSGGRKFAGLYFIYLYCSYKTGISQNKYPIIKAEMGWCSKRLKWSGQKRSHIQALGTRTSILHAHLGRWKASRKQLIRATHMASESCPHSAFDHRSPFLSPHSNLPSLTGTGSRGLRVLTRPP